MSTTTNVSRITFCLAIFMLYYHAKPAEAYVASCFPKTAKATSTQSGGAVSNDGGNVDSQACGNARDRAKDDAEATSEAEVMEKGCDPGCIPAGVTHSSSDSDANGNATPPTVTSSGDTINPNSKDEFLQACNLEGEDADDCLDYYNSKYVQYWAFATATVTDTATLWCVPEPKGKKVKREEGQTIGEFLGIY